MALQSADQDLIDQLAAQSAACAAYAAAVKDPSFKWQDVLGKLRQDLDLARAFLDFYYQRKLAEGG